MPALLPLALLTGVVLVVVATALLFTVRPSRRLSTPPGRGVAASLGAGVAAVAVATALGGDLGRASAVGALVTGSTLLWLRVARPWAVRGLWTWALTVLTVLLYLVYVIVWSLTADLTTLGRVASIGLWTVEVFVALLGIGYVWELVDVLARRRWQPSGAAPLAARRPFVSLHVPTHNEPPDMVIETLEHLLRLDYEDYEVLLVDNNTTDPDLWRPVEQFCALHERLTFIHLENWPATRAAPSTTRSPAPTHGPR